MDIERVSYEVIGSAITVHKTLGPGLLESSYETCMVHELNLRGLSFEREKSLSVMYKGTRMDCGYRVDLLVEDQLIVELKSVERLDRIHIAQMITYLKLSGCRLGLLINFNVPHLVSGVRRVALNYPDSP